MSRNDLIRLDSGRLILLDELRQHKTHEGMLMGKPSVQWNKDRLKRLVVEYRDKPYKGGPLLIEPAHLESLPAVTCVGRFHSPQPAKDRRQMGSGLVIIWLQEEFAFPISPGVLEQLQKVEWDKHAEDFSY